MLGDAWRDVGWVQQHLGVWSTETENLCPGQGPEYPLNFISE